MEEKKHSPRQLPWAPIAAAAIIFLGLLLMSSVFTRGQQLLVDGEDGQLMKTAQSVDNNILGHFAWYCSDLNHFTSCGDLLAAERAWLSRGRAQELLELLREVPLSGTGTAAVMLAARNNAVALSTDGRTDYAFLTPLGQLDGVDISLWQDGAGRPYVALTRTGPELSYTALIDGETFFTIAERQTAAETKDGIQLLDAQNRYLFHRTSQGVRVDPVDSLAPGECAGLQLMLAAQRSGQSATDFFPDPQPDGKSDTARLAVLPASGNENGCFTVSLARNYDEILLPFRSAAAQIALCGVIVMAGVGLLLLFLLRSRRSHRQIEKEVVLLRAKAEAMEQLSAQAQALAHRQRLETIGALTSGIAHDFNNLLTPIMGYSILILEKLPPEDTESYDNALEIYNASQKAKSIIARLSRLSRKDTSDGFHPVRLDPLVQQVMEVAAPARPRAVRVETELADQGRLLLGDETQLFQLLLNLLLNSFDALGEAGGTVRVTTRADERRISLRAADNGPGIPEEIKGRIFDPFFTTKGSGKGIGLGLAIVQQIVEAHSASITVDSAQGQGTAFTILFPIFSPDPETNKGSAD